MTSQDPRKLLEALLSGAPVPQVPPAELEKARALAQADEAPPPEVEALPEALALAVLEAAVRRRRSALAEALSECPSRELSKAAKRALYRLRSAGVETQARPRKVEPAPLAAPAPAEEPPSLLSPITSEGERALVVVRPKPGGGLELFQILASDSAGVTEVVHLESGRGAYRKILRAVRSGKQAHLEVPLERARQILSAAAARNLASRRPLPEGAEEVLRRLGVKPREELDPLPPPAEGDAALALRGHELHREPEIASWLPPKKELEVLSQLLSNAAASPLELSEAQRREQLSLRVRACMEGFFTEEVKKLYARRLWEMAELFELTSRPEPGSIARAEARRLFHLAGGISRFSELLFEKVLILLQQASSGQRLPEPGDRLSPQGPAGPEPRSPGGLILP